MKKLSLMLVIGIIFLSTSAFAFQGPPEDFDKLNANAEKKFILESSGKGIINIGYGRTKPYPGKPKDAAEKFLKEYHRMFKLSKDLKEIRFNRKGGVRGKINQFDYLQYYNNIPVYSSEIKVRLDMRNRIIRVICSIKEIGDISVEPVIQLYELEGILSRNAPAYGPIVGTPKLFVYVHDGKPVLAYYVKAYKEGTDKGFKIMVDSTTGEVLLEKIGQRNFMAQSKGEPPNPVNVGNNKESNKPD